MKDVFGGNELDLVLLTLKLRGHGFGHGGVPFLEAAREKTRLRCVSGLSDFRHTLKPQPTLSFADLGTPLPNLGQKHDQSWWGLHKNLAVALTA